MDYYLFCREKYKKILLNTNEVLNRLEILQYQFINENNLQAIEFNNQSKYFFTKLKTDVEDILTKINIKICDLCNHSIVEDFIDISPDKSVRIQYCEICEYTVSN